MSWGKSKSGFCCWWIFLPSLLLWSCLLDRVVGTNTSSSNPVIVTAGENFETGDVGSNWTILCKGRHPVTWFFYDEPAADVSSRVSITEEEIVDNKENGGGGRGGGNSFAATLFIYNVTGEDEGRYYCYYQNDPLSTMIYDFIYLRVNADEGTYTTADLLVIGKKRSLDNVGSYIGMPATLPCKPARRSVTVELSNDHGELKPNVPGSRVLYNETEGYTLLNVGLTDQDHYTCTGRQIREGVEKTQSLFIFLRVMSTVPVVEKPTIDATFAEAVSVGSDFSLVCSFNPSPNANILYSINWTEPTDVINSGRASLKLNCLKGGLEKKCDIKLHVEKAVKEDAGLYTCNVNLTKTNISVHHKVMIYDKGEEFLNASTQSNDIEVNASTWAQWVITMEGFPRILGTNYKWERNGQPITSKPGGKYQLSVTKPGREILLKIDDAQLADFGSYSFVVNNGFKTVNLSLNLIVRDKPQFAKVNKPSGGDFYKFGDSYTFVTEVDGYPHPKVEWTFQECNMIDDCRDNELVELESTSTPYIKQSRRGTESMITFTALNHGYIDVEAKNNLAKEVDGWTMKIIDFDDDQQTGFSIVGNEEPTDRTEASYLCSVTNLYFRDGLTWERHRMGQIEPLNPKADDADFSVTSTKSKWSYQSRLVIHKIEMADSGDYFCRANDLNGTIQNRTVSIHVQERIPADFHVATNLNDTTIRFQPGDEMGELICRGQGRPMPVTTWFKDGVPSDEWPESLRKMLTFVTDESRLKLASKPEYAGLYTCKVHNDMDGGKERYMQIEIDGVRTISRAGIIIMSVLGCCILILVTWLAIKCHKDRKRQQFLIYKRRMEFMNGATENINPDLPVHDQVNLLPYYDTWEFPKENLKLGILLGSGAFGQVVKAEAFGIVDTEPSTTVAVKMVKSNATESHVNALVSELKIMVHLGRHVNVVNLLGACTKELAKKGELLVIVEYCKYGSLLSYLHRHKSEFVDQLDPNTGLVDSTIGPPLEDIARANRNAANGYRFLEVVSTSNDSKRKCGSSNGPKVSYNPSDDYDCNNVPSVCTDMSFVSNSVGTDGRRTSSSGSTWNEQHYRGDYQHREVQPITTTDILCWSFQIARGMEYLSSRKVLHGDLAARNVLLADNNVVKICDFGLAKELYKDNYKKKSEGVLLPVKWMSPESIYFGVFSTHSDVWSFAVTVWELFSLGKTPYPGMDADNTFYTMVNSGYRMEQPPYAPKSVYDLMRACWSHEPADRPTFSNLVERFGNLIGAGDRQRYIDLNEHYCRMMNRDSLEVREDYLLQMGVGDLVLRDDEEDGDENNKSNEPIDLDRTYVNVKPPSPDYLLPNPPLTTTNNLVVNGEYGNFQGAEQFPNLRQLANNAGYVFMNSLSRPSSDIEGSSTSQQQQFSAAATTTAAIPPSRPAAFTAPADIFSPRPIKDSPPPYNEQEKVTTTTTTAGGRMGENNQTFNFNHNDDDNDVLSNNFLNYHHYPAPDGDDDDDDEELNLSTLPPDLSSSPCSTSFKEIPGISNINYVPNNLIFPPKPSLFCDNSTNNHHHNLDSSDLLCRDDRDSQDLSKGGGGGVLSNNNRNNSRSKRQKNDSGISSIGSNHEHNSTQRNSHDVNKEDENNTAHKFPSQHQPFYYDNNQLAEILVNGHESK